LAACLGVQIGAAERATFILNDGTRESGDVVFHGSGNRNIIDDFLNLGQGGKEKGFPVDQVALIDFAGGEPSGSELQQLPGGEGHLLVLRGGVMQRGTLVNLVNGDTVQWRNEAGQPQQYAIRDVTRIYLNPSAARRLFPQAAAAAAQAEQPGVSTADQAVPRGAVRVSANQPWVATGIRVMKGQRVAFTASGQVQFSGDRAHVSGPDGNPSVPSQGLPVGEMAVGGLIAKVGDSQPFPIGSNRQPIVMPASGLLMLGVNDTEMGDNSGFFAVTVSSARGR
jgi:hypothetical protein